MKKNVASQVVGCQMVSATDGSAFTSSVTVSVTGDAGTQATGSVGSGACTHEGNGYHTYAPAQAETNYDLIAFTFTGTGAVPATVQIYTSFPQTGDSFVRVGAPAGASVSADIAAVKVDTAAILVDTGTDIPATLVTIDDFLDTEIAAIKAKTDQLTFTTANQVDATTITVATGAIGTGDIAAAALNEIADAVLDRNMATGTDSGSTTVRTVRQALRASRNKVSISAGTATICKEDDATTSWTAAITTTAGDPISAVDPAGP